MVLSKIGVGAFISGDDHGCVIRSQLRYRPVPANSFEPFQTSFAVRLATRLFVLVFLLVLVFAARQGEGASNVTKPESIQPQVNVSCCIRPCVLRVCCVPRYCLVRSCCVAPSCCVVRSCSCPPPGDLRQNLHVSQAICPH